MGNESKFRCYLELLDHSKREQCKRSQLDSLAAFPCYAILPISSHQAHCYLPIIQSKALIENDWNDWFVERMPPKNVNTAHTIITERNQGRRRLVIMRNIMRQIAKTLTRPLKSRI